MNKLTHVNSKGEAHMVDVTDKKVTSRVASARSIISMSAETIDIILSGTNKKGDVLSTARIAGIQGAKKCSDLIPLCHPLMISKVTIDIEVDSDSNLVRVVSTVKVSGKTGVEMEALTACSIASLTIYDMCKAVDKRMVIKETLLLSKTGGKSGDFLLNEKK